MKIHIKPYINWVGPYQILDKFFPFLSEETRDKIADKISNKPFEVIHKWRKNTFYKDKIRIDNYDTWAMHHTLAPIIAPMLRQLKETKHGIPHDFVHDKDLDMLGHSWHDQCDLFPETLEEYRGISVKQWDEVMDKMIWSFQSLVDFDEKDAYWEPYWIQMTEEEVKADIEAHPNCALRNLMKTEKGPHYKIDRALHDEFYQKQQEGFELFGKYYCSLWD